MLFCSAVLGSDQINALLKPGRIHQRIDTDTEFFHRRDGAHLGAHPGQFPNQSGVLDQFSRGTGMD